MVDGPDRDTITKRGKAAVGHRAAGSRENLWGINGGLCLMLCKIPGLVTIITVIIGVSWGKG